MPAARLEPVAHFIRRSLQHAQLTDAELLTRFAACRDEGAFSALVGRHGPLVLGVCRRALRDSHAAEDAFQATFLLLARKADSLACPERLSNWLHGVACRVAARARAREARRRVCEGSVPIPAPALPEEGFDWHDLRVVLDEEVNRLPARQRDAVVLCYFEGRTNAQAALLLGCPRGSVATLLSRARQRLRQRLAGRGLALPAALAGAWLAQQARATALPASLTSTTVEAALQCAAGGLQAAALVSSPAAALAKGVLRTMFLKKLKVILALFLILVALAGTGASLTGRTAPVQQPVRQSGDSPSLTLSTALLRSLRHAGFRVREEGAAWRISLPGADILEAERKAAQTLLNTEVAYWNLYGAYGTLSSREQGLRLAHEALELSRLRYKAGQARAGDIYQSCGQCELFRAQRLQALSTVRENERHLRNVMGMEIEDGRRLVPSDSPRLATYRPDWNAALGEALKRRPELCMTRREIKAAQMDLVLAKNQLLPDLRFLSTYGDNSFGTAFDAPGFASVQIREAKLALARSMEVLKDQELKTQRFLGTYYEQISVSYEQMRAIRAQREAFPEQLRARNEEHKAGRGTLDVLLEAQRFWADALANEHAAIVTYNYVLAGFDFARGATLKRHRISMEETGSPRGGETDGSALQKPRDSSAPPQGDLREDRLLTPKDLMQLLKISQSTFEKLREARRLPEPLNLNGASGGTALLRWRRDEVLAWIDARCPPVAEWAGTWARRRSGR
jgi:RNA polymerase sigma factor (sigma-70 family)